MYCSRCGASVGNGEMFCSSCGMRLVAAVQQASDTPAPQPAQASAQQTHTPVQPSAGQQSVAAGRGCFGSAWDDTVQSPGWFGKVAFMGLIQLVPILNWVNMGYALNWARDVAFGRREAPPQKVVTNANFRMGFFAFAILFIAGCAMGLLGYLLGYVFSPRIGGVLNIALSLFVYTFAFAMVIRMTVFDNFGAGFGFEDVMRGYTRKFGTFLCVIVLPTLIQLGIDMAVGLAASALMAGVAGADFLSLITDYRSLTYAGPSYVLARYGGALAVAIIIFFIAYYATMVCASFGNLLLYRGLGHYVSRYMPEWLAEAPTTSGASALYSSDSPVVQMGSDDLSASAQGPVAGAVAPTPAADAQASSRGVAQPSEPIAPVAGNDSTTSVLVESQTTRSCALQLERKSGERYLIDTFPVTIGKGSAADICISGNSTISRVHARILSDSDMFAVVDLGSTNKTFINGYHLTPNEPTIVSDGDELRMGTEVMVARVVR